MFYCQITGKRSKLNESPRKIILVRREKIYTRRERDEETGKWEDVFVAKGWEIVKEVDASADGEAEWNSWDKDQRWLFLKNYYAHLIPAWEEWESKQNPAV